MPGAVLALFASASAGELGGGRALAPARAASAASAVSAGRPEPRS